MSDPTALLADLRRYRDLVAAALPAASLLQPWAPQTEDDDSMQVERGIVLARIVARGRSAAPYSAGSEAADDWPSILAPTDRLIAAANYLQVREPAVVDRAGHFRRAYRPLLIYSLLQSYRLAYEALPRETFGQWEEAARAWSDQLEQHLGELNLGPASMTAPGGSQTAEACWTALALHLAGKVFVRDAWTDLAADTFGRLTHGQQPSGAFLAASASDDPQALGFSELTILHAAASYAVQAEDRIVAAAVLRNTDHHQAALQPDHATSQPWALFAFAWNPATRPLADAMLHSAAAADGPLTWMLLADALYCLGLFG